MSAYAEYGTQVYKTLDLDESEEQIKASGRSLVLGFIFYNAHATALRYLKFYNASAANVTVGTTVPDMTIPLKAGQTTGFMLAGGVEFRTGLTIAATTGLADNDNGAPGANEVIGTVIYV